MSQIEKKDTTLSLKITSSLKSEIDETAKAEGKSINDFVYSAMLEYISNYKLEKLTSYDLPSIEEAKKILAERINTLTDENIEAAKKTIHNMLTAGEKSKIINLFDNEWGVPEDSISNEDKKTISNRVNEKLLEVGYFTHIFKNNSFDNQFYFSKFDIAIALDESGINRLKKADEPPPMPDDFSDEPPF